MINSNPIVRTQSESNFDTLLNSPSWNEGGVEFREVSLSELWYQNTELSNGFIATKNSSDYQDAVNKKESAVLSAILERNPISGPCTIIDLGCSDGTKSAAIIEGIKEGQDETLYVPVDISKDFLSMASKRVSDSSRAKVILSEDNNINFLQLHSLIDKLDGRKHPGPRIFLLLGNTLGSFEGDDVIKSISRSMRQDDVFIFGNGIISGKTVDWGQMYDDKESETKKWLLGVPKLFGIDPDKTDFKLRYNSDKGRVEALAEVKQDMKVSRKEKSVDLRSGDNLILAISKKYTDESLRDKLNGYFSSGDLSYCEDKSYAVGVYHK